MAMKARKLIFEEIDPRKAFGKKKKKMLSRLDLKLSFYEFGLLT
jgi:hypothetical protein